MIRFNIINSKFWSGLCLQNTLSSLTDEYACGLLGSTLIIMKRINVVDLLTL